MRNTYLITTKSSSYPKKVTRREWLAEIKLNRELGIAYKIKKSMAPNGSERYWLHQ